MNAAVILISFVILGGGLSIQVYRYSIGEKQQNLEQVANRISTVTTDIMSQFSSIHQSTFRILLSTMTENGKIHAVITDVDGKIIITSDENQKNIGVYVNTPTVQKVIANNYFSGMSTLGGIYRGQNYTVGVPYYNAVGKLAGCVFVTTSVSDMNRLLFDISRMFLLSALLVFIIAAFLSFFAVRNMTKPIKMISTAAKSFARGDFKVRVPVMSGDEIGELTCAFNNMADSIEKSEELRRTFVANVSHELRSPMTSIAGYVDGILDGTIPQEREGQYLSVISGEVRRLSRLVSRMLNITRLQAEDMSSGAVRFDFCELVRRAIISFEARIEEQKLQMDVAFSEYSIEVFANEDAIFQAVYNLTENAIKFSAIGETVSIDVHTHAGKLWFCIKNRGAEIPEAELQYVFDRFHKTDRSRGNDKSGLGLGLYIVKTIINQHHGDVGVSSLDGETEFYFSIPLDNNTIAFKIK